MTDSDRQWDDQSEPEISIDSDIKLIGGGDATGAADLDVVGERFGKYLIVGELAVGGMAEIFLGVQRGLEGFVKVVVIKRVLEQFSKNPEFVRMFIDEARLAARLEHPNIVRTYEFGEVAGQYFTTMEYLAGEDLSKVLNRLALAKRSMPFNVAAKVIHEVCAGLQFAHQLTDTAGRPLNLVHRDVNPANIIITYGGEVKIIDFGVAKTDANKTINKTIKGKIAYMSPEQLVARGVDARSDVFSTGIVLWELITGQPLFARESEAATVYALMNDPIPPASRYRRDVPPELDNIVGCALSRTPADRYDSAEEMASALEKFLAGQPKCDGRVIARITEELFGAPRAQAKRSIAQTRSLGRNISRVMKLRTDVRADLLEGLDNLASGSGSASSDAPTDAARRGRESDRAPGRGALLWTLVMLMCVAGGVLYVLYGTDLVSTPESATAEQPASGASLEISSTPTGAAISIGGEPTGLKTPATLTGLTGKEVSVRLELPGYGTVTDSVAVAAGDATRKHFTFVARETGRLIVSDLPSGAVVLVDGQEFEAGELIDIAQGTHEVRVVVNGRTTTQQQIETTAGDQHWQLAGDVLVRANP
jgi:eukaryotic-like serine/threonine-protein kinase